MSYRTYVNNIQLFGNNDCFKDWIEFIKSQGIKVNEDYSYKGYIKDFDKALTTLETIAIKCGGKDKEKIVESMFYDKYLTNLTDRLMNVVEGFYLFLPVQFIKCCEKCIQREFVADGRLYNYTIKPNKRIRVSAS